jgi:hypothetical protein
VDLNKCIDWTTTRRAGYKPGSNESVEPQYTATRDFSGKGKSSKKSGMINKSGSKKKSAVKTNKTDASSTRSAISTKSQSAKRDISSNTSMMRTANA